jgi:2-polyprenyl-6-methoxyphenol hydroxylase-like FAD-dependent oxidoreductase
MGEAVSNVSVVVVGAAIGGLTTALSLAEIGVEVDVYDSVREVRALGVGINLLPHAVRELDALGLMEALADGSVAPTTLVYCSHRGQEIWRESRGRAAGYPWPQLSIHRGVLQEILLDAFVARVGRDHLHLDHTLVHLDDDGHRAEATFTVRSDGREIRRTADAIVASDGIHSAARAQRYPDEGPPRWNGALLWRGLTDLDPVLDGRSMVWAGHRDQKFVGYPIADLPGGRQTFNFIAELRRPDSPLGRGEDWNRPGVPDDFLPEFEDWSFDWLDVPAIIRQSPGTYLFPMVDRDPVERWSFGATTLLGDAAHPMYPIGSNGASQAILDARALAGCLSAERDVRVAFERYEQARRPATAAIVVANRGLGPELPMQLVYERAPEGFERVDDVISRAEIDEVTEGYRATAGFALSALRDDPRSLLERMASSSATPSGTA